jgi:hypothetical protein
MPLLAQPERLIINVSIYRTVGIELGMVEGVEGFEVKLQCLRFRNFGDLVTVGHFPCSYKVRLGGIHAH